MINRIARSVLFAVNAPSNVVGAIKAVGTGTVGFVRSVRAEMDNIEEVREAILEDQEARANAVWLDEQEAREERAIDHLNDHQFDAEKVTP